MERIDVVRATSLVTEQTFEESSEPSRNGVLDVASVRLDSFANNTPIAPGTAINDSVQLRTTGRVDGSE